jgi:hypothetical protein
MVLSRPKRMRRPRAMTRRIAQVSVDKLRNGRVLGVDIRVSFGESAIHANERVSYGIKFSKRDEAQGGTSYNNNV